MHGFRYVACDADYAIVGRLMGPVELGYYSLAFMLISIPVDKIVATCNQATFPVFCRLSHDRARVRKLVSATHDPGGSLATPAWWHWSRTERDLGCGQEMAAGGGTFRMISGRHRDGAGQLDGWTLQCHGASRHQLPVHPHFSSVAIYPPLFLHCRRWGSGCRAICYPIMVLALRRHNPVDRGCGVGDIVSSQLPLLGLALVVIAIHLARFRG